MSDWFKVPVPEVKTPPAVAAPPPTRQDNTATGAAEEQRRRYALSQPGRASAILAGAGATEQITSTSRYLGSAART